MILAFVFSVAIRTQGHASLTDNEQMLPLYIRQILSNFLARVHSTATNSKHHAPEEAKQEVRRQAHSCAHTLLRTVLCLGLLEILIRQMTGDIVSLNAITLSSCVITIINEAFTLSVGSHGVMKGHYALIQLLLIDRLIWIVWILKSRHILLREFQAHPVLLVLAKVALNSLALLALSKRLTARALA